jgi:hypothetical protein
MRTYSIRTVVPGIMVRVRIKCGGKGYGGTHQRALYHALRLEKFRMFGILE